MQKVKPGGAELCFLVYAIAFSALVWLHPFSRPTFLAIEDIAGVIPAWVAGALSLKASRKGPRSRLAWLGIGGGCVSWAIGEIVWTFYEVALGREAPFPSFADVGYLS